MKKKGRKLSLWGLENKIRKLGFKLSSINELLAKELIDFDEWKEVHDDTVDEYLKTWNKISRCFKKNDQGGEHEQGN